MKQLMMVLSVLFVVACSSASDNKDVKVQDTVQDDQALVVNDENAKEPVTVTEEETEEETEEVVPVDPKDLLPPMEAIKSLDKKIEIYHLGKDLTPEQVAENKKLKREIIRGTFDIKELCRLSLGSHWTEIAAVQQKQFVKLMTTLLETKAIFSREQLHGSNKYYNMTYEKEVYDDTEKKKSTVTSKMHVPKEKLTLDITYKLLLTPYGWKIYDVIVDDASLLSNYKFQFDRIITKNGFDDLIARMNSKLEKIKK